MDWDKVGKFLDKGVDLVGKCLSFARESETHTELPQAIQQEQQKDFERRVLSSIADVSVTIENIAQNVVKQITQKIESDQLEKLVANVKGLQFAVKFQEANMIGPSVVTLSEHIEYAKNRIDEGKFEWLEPWMMAESIQIAALLFLAKNDHKRQVVHALSYKFRLKILDYTGPALMNARPLPWVKISDFVDGRNEEILSLISSSSAYENQRILQAMCPIYVDSLFDGMEVRDILVKPGDVVENGQPLIILEGSKVVMDIPSPQSGVVFEIQAKAGETLQQGNVILYLRN